MPRFSSLRSLWTAARSGIVCSLLVCAGSFSSSAFAQMDYAAMDAAKLSGMQTGSVDGTNGAQQSVSLTNINTGVKKADSNKILGSLQAILYSDAQGVGRVNLAKIDYEGLSAFVDDLTEKAAGSVQSRDDYQVKLREYQKREVKDSFKRFASTLQNTFIQKLFNNKIDELFFISYGNNSGTGCVVVAVPVDGLSEEDQNTALDALNNLLNPITVFKRYGFVIAVISHDKQIKADIESITERYEAKALDEQKGPAYGAYSASGSNNSVASGMNSGMNSRQSNTGSAALAVSYMAEVQAAEKDAKVRSRQQVLPFVRSRFAKPATAEDGKEFVDALRQCDGAAFTIVSRNFSGIADLSSQTSSGDSVAQPFSAMGSMEDKSKAVGGVGEILESITSNKANETALKSLALSLSLVGTPKFVLVANFNDAENAQNFADAIQGAVALAKPMLQDSLNEKLASLDTEESVNISPLVDAVFDGIKPQTKGTKLAMVLDLDVLRANAELIRPLLGGKEAKSAQELESEDIDWGSADDTSAATSNEEENEFDDEESTELDSSDVEENEDSDDDPFGSDDEDDPFA